MPDDDTIPGRSRHFESRDIAVGDVTLATWIVPSGPEPSPCVVLAHGWAAVKEMSLDYTAASLAAAGITAIVFDHRGTGASTGLRGDLDPERQIEDYRAVLSFAANLPGVDASRLGVWGTSYSGGHVLEVAARDSRVRATVSQVPTISGSENTRRRVASGATPYRAEDFAKERERVASGQRPTYLPAVRAMPIAEVASEPPVAVLPADLPAAPDVAWGNDLARFYGNYPRPRLATWCNAVTLASQERYEHYEPGAAIEAAAEKPLLMIVGSDDLITPHDLAESAFETVRSSGARLMKFDGGHYDAYGVHLDMCSSAATDFFTEALK